MNSTNISFEENPIGAVLYLIGFFLFFFVSIKIIFSVLKHQSGFRKHISPDLFLNTLEAFGYKTGNLLFDSDKDISCAYKATREDVPVEISYIYFINPNEAYKYYLDITKDNGVESPASKGSVVISSSQNWQNQENYYKALYVGNVVIYFCAKKDFTKEINEIYNKLVRKD